MTDALHCKDCDSTDCPGFTTPRAKPEPVPDPPLRVASEATRRAAIEAARAAVDTVRRELKGSK